MTLPDQSEPPVLNTHNGFEIYPMPLFAAMETADVSALAQWYQQALGFGIVFQMPDASGQLTSAQPMLVHLRRHKYQDVLIRPAAPGFSPDGAGGLSLCFQAGEEVDQLAARAATVPAIGSAHVGPVADTLWNTRQVRIVDPDGRLLVFSQPRFDPELTRRMQQQFDAVRAAPT